MSVCFGFSFRLRSECCFADLGYRTVTIYDADRRDALAHCFELAKKYENYFSDTIETSDVSQINAHPYTPVSVHDETIELIQTGIRYGRLSDGRFDITVGKLSDAWNFSTERLSGGETSFNTSKGKEPDEEASFFVPDEALVSTLADGISYESVAVDEDAHTVTLQSDACAIDLGGIAKGYIADQMKSYLEDEGITSGLINLGGNILTLGAKPDGSDYTIGIQKPFAPDGEAILKLFVSDLSVVTSGTYQRYAIVDGTIYHHILDTATGYPYHNGLSSVTVLSPSSVDGDALSTTLFTMGLTDGLSFAEDLPDVEAIFITTENELYYSSGFLDGTIRYEEQ